MAWHHVYKLKTAALGARTFTRKIFHPKVEKLAAKFPARNIRETATQTETQAYQAIFAPDLLAKQDKRALLKTKRAQFNLKSKS